MRTSPRVWLIPVTLLLVEACHCNTNSIEDQIPCGAGIYCPSGCECSGSGCEYEHEDLRVPCAGTCLDNGDCLAGQRCESTFTPGPSVKRVFACVGAEDGGGGGAGGGSGGGSAGGGSAGGGSAGGGSAGGSAGGSGGGGGSPDGGPACPCPTGVLACPIAVADSFIRNGTWATSTNGTNTQLGVKGDPNLGFARKSYLVFETAGLPSTITHADLALTLMGDASPTGLALAVYGIIDGDDWKPSVLAETAITWDTAPKNNLTDAVGFAGQGTQSTSQIRLLGAYPIDPDAGVPGVVHRIDVTDFIRWAVGQGSSYSVHSTSDPDGLVTITLAHDQPIAYRGGPTYWSKESPNPCQAPRLEVK